MRTRQLLLCTTILLSTVITLPAELLLENLTTTARSGSLGAGGTTFAAGGFKTDGRVYTVDSATIEFYEFTPGTLTVHIYDDDGAGDPGTRIATLATPGGFGAYWATGIFMPTNTITLQPNQTYWLVATSLGSHSMGVADSTNKAGPGSFINSIRQSFDAGGSWGSFGSTEPARFRVDATPVIHYVWTNSPSPTSPYTNWTTAAHTIQEAVDAANHGEKVLVQDGVYDVGGSPAPGASLTNRVNIRKDILVESVNGPEATVIRGKADHVTGSLGSNAVRCVYMYRTNAMLAGFTLEEGHTFKDNTTLNDVSGGGALISEGTLSNCIVRGCMARNDGGGVYGERLYSCVIVDNVASGVFGGGVYVFDNDGPVIDNCVIISNRSSQGGGAYVLSYDQPGVIRNCTIAGNVGSFNGGIDFNSDASSPTGFVFNSIIYGNSAPFWSNYYGQVEFTNTLTSPLPAGLGNLDADPQIYDLGIPDGRLRASSPCIDAGSNLIGTASATDIQGEPRIFGGTIDIGADEACLSAAEPEISGINFHTHWKVPPGVEVQFQYSDDMPGYIWHSFFGVYTSVTPEFIMGDVINRDYRSYRLNWVGP